MTPQSTTAGLVALIMAAGASTRFGACKLTAEAGGLSLMERAIGNTAHLERQTLVVGAYAEQIESSLAPALKAPSLTLLRFPDWGNGLGASLSFGVQHLGEANAVLVVLADQALLQRSDLDRLIDGWRKCPDAVACAQYNGTLGVPAIFPKRFWPQLLALRGDEGARKVLRQLHEVVAVPMARAALDVDTTEDLQAVRAYYSTFENDR